MNRISIANTDELREMRYSEGLIIQGCGGDLTEWIDGINDLLTNEGILLEGTKFESVMAFKHDELTNLLFLFSEDVKLNVGKLAIWRIASHSAFSGTWLSDYVNNRLGGFTLSAFEKEICRLGTFKDTESSFDFQCDETGGWPTCLMWNRTECKAWLAPSDSVCSYGGGYENAMRACEKRGIMNCESVEDFNAILDSLGEDAKQCKIYDDMDEVDIC